MRKHILIILLLAFVKGTIANPLPKNSAFAASQKQGFIENKGQILTTQYEPNTKVKYLLNRNGLNVQLRASGFSYDTYTLKKEKQEGKQVKVTYQYHRVDIELVNSNPSAIWHTEGKSEDYFNYFNVPNKPEGVEGVYHYNKVVAENIYPGIDIEYLLDEKQEFKYNFIVHPGADYKQILMRFLGAQNALTKNGIKFITSSGELIEKIPASWTETNGKQQMIAVNFRVQGENTYGFETSKEIKTNEILVIDPTPVRRWGDYFGGSGSENYPCLKADGLGNIYLSGTTNSSSQIATAGAFQNTYNANDDFFILKMASNGSRNWCTYFGGASVEIYPAITTMANGTICFSGSTESSSGLSTTGAFQTSGAGGSDLIIANFNSGGSRVWSTYFGGTNSEYNYSINSDNSGNIYVSGSTLSFAGIATTGSHQTALLGGLDIFLVKINSIGQKQWATYYGGASSEDKSSAAIDASGNVYLSFYTTSASGVATTGASQTTLAGGIDLAIVKFNSSGVRQWATYFGGNVQENGSNLSIDASGNLFVTGMTTSTTGIATPLAQQTTLGGNYDIILAKFDASGGKQWSTYVGGTGNDIKPKIENDASGNVFLVFETTSTTTISTTNSFQPNLSGIYDLALLKYNTFGVKIFGTYYGGTSGEGLSGITISNSNDITITAITGSVGSFASTSGATQPSTLGDDIFISQFYECTAGAIGTMGTISGAGGNNNCSGASKTYSLSTTTTNAVGYRWTVPAGWTINSGQGTTNINVTTVGTGTLSVKAYNSCGDSSTAATLAVTVNAIPSTPSAITGAAIVCHNAGSAFSVTNVAGLSYNWVLPNTWSGTSATNSINVTPNIYGKASDTIRVRAYSTALGCYSLYQWKKVDCSIAPTLPSLTTFNNPVCRNVANTFAVDSLPGATSYTWTFPTGWTLGTPSNGKSIIVTPGTTAIAGNLTVRGTSATCGTGVLLTQAILAPVTAPSQPGIISGPSSICANGTGTYTISAVSGANSYLWQVPLGWSITSGQGTTSVNIIAGTSSGAITVNALNGGNNSCSSVPRTLNLSVITAPATPNITTYPSQVCKSSSYTMGATAISGATSYSWTLPSGFTVNSNNSVTSNITNLFTGTNIAATNTVELRANNGTCASAPAIIYISGNNNLPSLTGNITGSASLCAYSTQTYSVNADANALSYNWVFPSGWSVTGGNGTNAVTAQASTNTGLVEVTAVNGVCWSNKLTLAITTVNPAPLQPGTISYSGNLCSGKSTTFSVSTVSGASTYNWVLPSGWSGSSTTNSISVTPGAADTLRISASNGSCTSPVRKQFMNIIPTPTEPSSISGVNNICVNNTSTFTIPRQSNASSYVWTYPSPGYTPIGITNDTFLTVNIGSSALNGNITVAANKLGCSSTAKTLGLIVNSNIPNMPGSITGSPGVCIGSTHEFSITPVSNASSYLWSFPNGWSVVSGQNTTNIVLSPSAATGIVSVKAISGFCSSQPSNFAVNYAGIPPEAPKITGDSTPCVNSTIGFEASYVLNGTIYEWKAPTGWTINQPGNRTTNILIGSPSGAIQVKVSNAFCSSKYTTMNVVAKTPPTPSSIEGESFVKSFTIRDYSVQNIQGTSFFWEVPTDWVLLSGNYSNKISVLTGSSSGTIRVSANNECGNGTEVMKPVYSSVAAGIKETKIAQNFLCYPQPANHSFTLSFVANRDLEDAKIELFDLLGQQINTIYTGKLSRGNTYENNIDASYLPEGVYLLQLSDMKNKQTIKIIIHH
jgi:hypothetical protein